MVWKDAAPTTSMHHQAVEAAKQPSHHGKSQGTMGAKKLQLTK